MIRGQASLLPSGPNTKLDPTNAKSSRWLITDASDWKRRRPASVFSTSSAKTICSPSPQATVRLSIARRLVEQQYAIVMIRMSPTSGCRRGRFRTLAAIAQTAPAATAPATIARSRLS